MKATLVGYPQTGKTTLFEALTGQYASQKGGSRGRPNIAVVRVPDDRVDRLSKMFRPKKTTYAEVMFADSPGSRGAGRGLDPATLLAVQEADALVLVLRGFADVDGTAARPERELTDFEAELVLNDLGIVERRLERLAKMHDASREAVVLERCRVELDGGRSLRQVALDADEIKAISGFAFLSCQPLLAVLNTAEQAASEPLPGTLETQAETDGVGLIAACATVESEIAQLDPDDQGEFLASMGLGEPASARLIRAAYALLDTISFFTVGEDEVRAWTVRRGSLAPRAAGCVHSDIERGFIRAEVMDYGEFIEAGSEAKMKAAGRLRVEGKEYVVNDGDIINFRFNV